jgi:hypothetical protein
MAALSGERSSQNKSTSKKAGPLINGLMRLGGASQDLSAARKPTGPESFGWFIFQGGRERGQFILELVAFLFGCPAAIFSLRLLLFLAPLA